MSLARIVDSNLQEGIPVIIDGVHFFLGHGDTFGRQPAAYRTLRSIFHNRMLQKLYSGAYIPLDYPLRPRVELTFAQR